MKLRLFFCGVKFYTTNMSKITLLLLTLFTLNTLCTAQNGKIAGKIIDGKTGETLPGATVMIEGTTKGTLSDFDGNYILSGLQPGKYTIISSYVTYDNKKFVDVVVKANDVTDFNISLDQSTSQTLGEVVVQAEMNKENTNTLLVMQKNNASVSDGISAEAVKKTPDRSTADVIKRVSGATIQDNKFAIIRGMSDRYNAGFINGAPLPSSETDKKAFSFDMFPASILDNIVILKTGRPDITGEFGGGVIDITTKNIPEKNALSITIGAGDNFQTTFKDFKTSKNSGKYDWIGMDDGSRALPKDLPQSAFITITNKDQGIENAKLFNYNWGFKNIKALPNLNFQGSLSNVGLKGKFGSVVALSYNSNNSRTFTDRQTYNYSGSNYDMSKINDYHDTTYSRQILASALWNLSYKITPNHQISLKNIYSINSEDRVITRRGALDATVNNWSTANVRWFTQNNVYSGQLIGDHYFEKPKIKFKWNGGYSNIERDVPNLSRILRTKTSTEENDDTPYMANIVNGIVITPASGGSMLFLHTLENMKSLRGDISRTFVIGKTKHDVQVGGSSIFRERTFTARLLGYSYYTKGISVLPNGTLAALDDETIFSQNNLGIVNGPGKYDGGFMVVESTTPSDSYHAFSYTNAGYLMLDSRFFDSKLRFVYGARYESYRQVFNNPSLAKDTVVNDILPSINAVYGVTQKINIRAAYYRTVARPEFRELAPFQFQDFTTQLVISGNPDLKRSLMDNYDLRFEWFPNAGQIVSLSGFYKNIDNAIEQVVDLGAAGGFAVTYANAKSARNVGAELEVRFKLSSFTHNGDSSRFLSSTTIFANCAYIQSQVDNSNSIGSTIRPLQGQSPYIINAGVQYLDEKSGWGAAVSYNLIGRRIIIVGGATNPTIWENPRHVLDFQISKSIKKFDIKLNLRDALAQNLVLYQDMDENGKFTKGSIEESKKQAHSYSYDNIFANTKLSPTLSLSLTYRFF